MRTSKPLLWGTFSLRDSMARKVTGRNANLQTNLRVQRKCCASMCLSTISMKRKRTSSVLDHHETNLLLTKAFNSTSGRCPVYFS